MRLGIGLGLFKQAAVSVGVRLFSAYKSRVIADGGTVEADNCAINALNNGLFQRASLLLIPSGYKSGKAYAEIPTNGNGDLTWTRASDAWRTNADGLIQRVPWNLLQQSETFSNATWTKNNTTISADSIIAPNGTLTADKLVETATSSTHWVFQSTTYTATSVTVSCYMKKGERNFGFIRTRTTTTDLFAWFNLNTGVVGTVESGITASITNVGDGWYRCVVVNPNPTTSANPSVIGLSNADNVNTYTGDGISGIFIWGAQLVEGSSAQTYFPTTDRLNVPRLSYMYGSCPALLLEPQRTNLYLRSEDFASATWPKSNVSITANNTTSPDGTVNASLFAANGTTNVKSLTQSVSVTSGLLYTISIYAKKNTNDFIQITSTSTFLGTTTFANYELNNGVLGTVGAGGTATITNVGNGWYRCTLTGTATATGSQVSGFYIVTSSTSARGESNSLGTSVYIWGSQLEAGAYPTTYIPTTTASATRIADSFSRSNIYTNGLITSSGGTWFVELRGNMGLTRDSSSQGINIGNSSTTISNGLMIVNTGTGRQVVQKIIGGTATTLYTTLTDTTKVAIKWNGTSADVFVNGTKQVTSTAFTTTLMEFLNGNASGIPRFIQAMALYPTPLSDTDCTTLTTL